MSITIDPATDALSTCNLCSNRMVLGAALSLELVPLLCSETAYIALDVVFQVLH